MTNVKLKGFQFVFPKDIREKAHIQEDQELIVETTNDHTIQIRPVPVNQADDKLMELLNNPEDMGNILFRDRNDIYDDTN